MRMRDKFPGVFVITRYNHFEFELDAGMMLQADIEAIGMTDQWANRNSPKHFFF